MTHETTENSALNTNVVTITGAVLLPPEFSHEVYGENFYKTNVGVKRLSEAADALPLIFSDRIINPDDIKAGTVVDVSGQVRSYNNYSEQRSRLILTIFAKDIVVLNDEQAADVNKVTLNGYICRTPIFRTTPFGREIADILLAVNRSYNKSDYIPIIAWGRNARFASDMSVGSNILVTGRMQSRTYQKKHEDGTVTDKVAFEVSVAKLERIPKEEIND